MNLFPLFAHLENKAVLVVGGGAVAARKVVLLRQAKARITVNAPKLNPELQRLAQQRLISWHADLFTSVLLDGQWLVIIATSDTALNKRVARLCEQARIWANVVDDPQHSSFHVPAIVDRAPLTIAISSGGRAPMLARYWREKLEALIDHSTGALAALLSRYRQKIKNRFPNLSARRHFYENVIAAQHIDQAEAVLQQGLSQPTAAKTAPGKVILVGAGPGEPGLLTLKALRALNQADVILHDRLVSAPILDLARRDAQRIFVGKTRGENHHQTQARIHTLMLEHARAGRIVVRLKGGDAFIFGRGGEELAVLAQHGIAFEVIPGITAAIACAAYAGIPLTHRQHAHSLHILTAHSAQSHEPHWSALARSDQTLVFYMGVAQLEHVTKQLMAHGLPVTTPFALIENGSLPQQRTLTGPLQRLPQLASLHDMTAPALLVIGEVTRQAATLHWFGHAIHDDDEHLRRLPRAA